MTNFFEKPLWPLYIFIIFYFIIDFINSYIFILLNYYDAYSATNIIIIRLIALLVFSMCIYIIIKTLNLINYTIFNIKLGTFVSLILVVILIILKIDIGF